MTVVSEPMFIDLHMFTHFCSSWYTMFSWANFNVELGFLISHWEFLCLFSLRILFSFFIFVVFCSEKYCFFSVSTFSSSPSPSLTALHSHLSPRTMTGCPQAPWLMIGPCFQTHTVAQSQVIHLLPQQCLCRALQVMESVTMGFSSAAVLCVLSSAIPGGYPTPSGQSWNHLHTTNIIQIGQVSTFRNTHTHTHTQLKK